MARFRLALLASCALLAAACSSSQPSVPTVAPARTYELAGFGPVEVARPGTVRLSFAIRQPSGEPLTAYKSGPGPHTGVHVIVVRPDLGLLIHRHPPIGTDGRIEETIRFPSPG